MTLIAEENETKLVTIKLIGNLRQQGFQVTVEIGMEDQRPLIERIGTLPPDAALLTAWQAWRKSYHSLKGTTRIRPLEISYHGSIHNKISDCIQQAQTFQQRFQHWLTARSFLPLNQLLREELNRTDHIRVVIRTDNLSLQQMPWHLWDLVDRYPLSEVGITPLSSQRSKQNLHAIQHNLSPSDSPNDSAHTHQVRVLAILGHSAGIDIERDRQLIEALPNAAVTYLVEPNRQQLNDQLWSQPWDILFFAGHSMSQASTSQAIETPLLASDPSENITEQISKEQTLKGRLYINPQDSLTINELSYGFRQAIANGLQLAIFNSCDGLGLAHELEPLGLPHMILMREPVPDSVAQTFLRHFLTAYAAGESLYLAEKQARERLQGLENTFPCASWLPALVHSSPISPPSWQQLKNRRSQIPKQTLEQALSPAQTTTPQLSAHQADSHSSRTAHKLSKSPAQQRNRALKSGAIAALLILGLRSLGALQPLELRTFDHLMSHQRLTSTTERILIVEATETDLNTYGYPLPDEVLADAIATLTPQNPRIIGLDIFRPNPTAPDLQQAFNENPQLIAACSPGNPDNPNRPGFAAPPNVPEDRLGFTTVLNDPDGVIRRQLMFAHDPNTDCSTRFSLSTLLALHYLEQENIYPESLDKQRTKLGKTTFTPLEKHTGPYHNIDSWGSQVFIGYRQQETFAKRITLSDLLSKQPAGKSDLGDLSQYAVLIGVSAPVSNPTDYFLTPMGTTQWPKKEIPGVALHAHMLNHLLVAALEGKGTMQTLPGWGESVWILGWSLLGGSTILWSWRKQSASKKIWLPIIATTIVIYVICLSAFWNGLLLPLIPTLLSFGLASILTQQTQWKIFSSTSASTSNTLKN
ncbi:MAG: CHASE2 domain-containing protein [Cyanobacteria bacterium J06650_10]